MKMVSKEESGECFASMHLRLFSSLSLSLSFEKFHKVPCASDSPFSLSLSLSLSLSSSFNVTAQRRRGRRGWSRSTESNGWKNNSKRYVFIKKRTTRHHSHSSRSAGVKTGDKVLLPEFGGQAVRLDEGPQKKEFLLFRDEEILGILQDE